MENKDKIFNSAKDNKCFPECLDKTIARLGDPNLYMQSIKLENICIYSSYMHFFILEVKGEVSSMKILSYSICSRKRYNEYDIVESSLRLMTLVCKIKALEYKNYPMKFSKLSLEDKYNKFRDTTSLESSILGRLAQKSGDYMY